MASLATLAKPKRIRVVFLETTSNYDTSCGFLKWKLRNRYAVLLHYSNHELKCACCGESDVRFLTIDHINGKGTIHRALISGGSKNGSAMYTWSIRNKFPPGFQVLCWNCNCARIIYKACPHTLPKITKEEIRNLLSSSPRLRHAQS
jgi:hypothetical protein